MFRAFCTKYLLGERFTVGLIERLRSSPRLREICGLDRIPSESTFSRFFSRLAGLPDPDTLMAQMVEKLRELLPGLGQGVAIDSTDIESYANPNRTKVRDTEATWGRRTAKGKSRKKDKKTEPFFGYKMHALNDTVYGVPLVHTVHPANQNDSPELPRLVEKAQAAFGWLRPSHLLADRGYDSQTNHKFLVGKGIAPIIHVRKPTADDGLYDGLYDKNGFPVCGDGKTPMDYIRTASNGHHLFRCPPGGCALKARSNGAMRYCDIPDYWQDPQDNLRAVGVVARASPEWKELYNRRQVIERMFGSLKRSRLLNRHQYLARRKVEVHITMSVLTYLATMLVRVLAGDMDRIRRMRIGVG